MVDAVRIADDAAGSLGEIWRRLGVEQRVAGVAAFLLILSTFGPFSFVEVAEILTGSAVLFLLKQRADRKEFHLPFGDGTAIMMSGLWAGVLIAVRLLDRPLGQTVLALACAATLAAAGARERAKRPADDLPPRPESPPPRPRRAAERGPRSDTDPTVRLPAGARRGRPHDGDRTRKLQGHEDLTELVVEEPRAFGEAPPPEPAPPPPDPDATQRLPAEPEQLEFDPDPPPPPPPRRPPPRDPLDEPDL